MNFCSLDGYLVSPAHALAKDPIDYHMPRLPLIGCNRIRCSQCQVSIRSQVGLGFRNAREKGSVGELYDLADLAASPVLIAKPDERLYLCRCHSWVEDGARALNDPEAEDTFQAPRLPWKCEGHPIAQLPHDFDGIAISQDNLAELVKRSLQGWTPPDAYPRDRARALWAVRMYVRLAQTSSQDVVASAAAQALGDPDPEVRARALQFFVSLELPAGMQRALALLEGDRQLYAGIADRITKIKVDKTLEDSLWRVASPLVGAPGRARDLARAEVIAKGKGRPILYDALASGDAEWVAAHVEDIVQATPALAKDLGDYIRLRFPAKAQGPVLDRLRSVLAAKGP